MIHAPNRTRWPAGAMVLHDSDAKSADMLMLVLGYTADGLCRTRYAVPNEINGDARQRTPREWRNDVQYLHDPVRFGVRAILRVAGGVLTLTAIQEPRP